MKKKKRRKEGKGKIPENVNFNHLHHDPWAGLGVFKLGEPGCQEENLYLCGRLWFLGPCPFSRT